MTLNEDVGSEPKPGPQPRDPAPTRWTEEGVAQALIRAFVTLDRLPRARGPRQPGECWPAHAVEWTDQLAQAELDEAERRSRAASLNRARIRPTSADIAQMDAAFDWLRELRAEDSGMALVATLWALRAARGRSVKALCQEKKWAPHTFYRKRAKALAFLATALNVRNAIVF